MICKWKLFHHSCFWMVCTLKGWPLRPIGNNLWLVQHQELERFTRVSEAKCQLGGSGCVAPENFAPSEIEWLLVILHVYPWPVKCLWFVYTSAYISSKVQSVCWYWAMELWLTTLCVAPRPNQCGSLVLTWSTSKPNTIGMAVMYNNYQYNPFHKKLVKQ